MSSGFATAEQIELDLGIVNVTRLLIITSNPALRQTVQKDYDVRFAANVKRLLVPPTAPGQCPR